MSKIKEQLQRRSELQMQYYGKFMDFIYDNLVVNRLSSEDIDQLESNLKSNSTHPICESVTPFSLKPTNNKFYNQLQGA